ncbi:phosphoenolpyruvate--protein phosphotransferase [Desulforamulus reducens MI-1]|uniref:Phosphoenolpyruvate-protein phosphotransferase n=1 Tax=Desulforamulus reducens (strain ATCC BAA-1160 / DSM 100696 / MI-1) TaxID=349161 RepID=A4J1C5_DESRM|nr:phosphoenolpyruvate--protein phosphotransferase [Desulforamulus reducens]ABO48878.1 phosphoenolpyruvate--protein phosphotransferase [Desulforamulus reducens MI-1]
MLRGIGVSTGLGIAKAVIYQKEDLIIPKVKLVENDLEAEVKKFEQAQASAKQELLQIKERVSQTAGKEKADIIEAQIMFLEDPTVVSEIINIIKAGNNAAYAVNQAVEAQARMLESLPVPEMQERAVDMRDMGHRLINILLDRNEVSLAELTEQTVLIAHDLTPSDTAQLSRERVAAIVTEVGSGTSHTAILARSLGIPAVVGIPGIVEQVSSGVLVAVDGSTGEVFIDPDQVKLGSLKQKLEQFVAEQRDLQGLVNEKAVTANGIPVRLAANIGKLSDIIEAQKVGVKEIGLFRTEFLYMDRNSLPTEEEQYQSYKQVVEAFPHRVIIRTLDIGGDKELPYLKLAKELNPFLGKRAIRLALTEKGLFKTQLRAILRASRHGNIGIMFPMIATLEELQAAKELLAAAKAELVAEGVELANPVEVGMMMETPAAALAADIFAKEVDFFSIGTNDLIQYTMAADRMNEQVAYLYQPTHPAICRLLEGIVQAGHNAGIWVGMCGEMAGNPEYTEHLLKMGLDELSMTRGAVLRVKQKIRQISL